MTLAKFQPNRTTGSKVMAKNLKKKALFRNRVPGTNYPVPGYPDFANYPVLVTRFLTNLTAGQRSHRMPPEFLLPVWKKPRIRVVLGWLEVARQHAPFNLVM